MPCEDSHLFHLGLLPDDYFVLGVSVRADELVDIFGVCETADLAACVDVVEWLAGERVPETNTPVSCATSTA